VEPTELWNILVLVAPAAMLPGRAVRNALDDVGFELSSIEIPLSAVALVAFEMGVRGSLLYPFGQGFESDGLPSWAKVRISAPDSRSLRRRGRAELPKARLLGGD